MMPHEFHNFNSTYVLKQDKRRLEKASQSKVTNEKREPQRCTAGYFGSCGKRRRVFNEEMVWHYWVHDTCADGQLPLQLYSSKQISNPK